MAYEALGSLQGTLNRILKQSHHPDINQQIISIHDEAVVLQLHLANNPEDLEERIREAANTTKEIIEYLFSEDNPLYSGWMRPSLKHSKQLRKAAEKFKKSTAGDVVDSINSKRRRLSDVCPSVNSSSRTATRSKDVVDVCPSVNSSSRTATRSKDVVVGLDEDLEEIKNWLTGNDPSQLQVLSIVGMGGTGKTTLAKLVYNDELIVRQFDIRAWVTVSQDYSVGSILSNLIDFLGRGFSDVIRLLYGDLHGDICRESLIRGYLEHRRFLIVIDDMCSKKAWDDIKMLFPSAYYASRIILTTRLHDVAAYVDSSCSNIHKMRLLDANYSWSLLKQKVFADEPCPSELEDVGNIIVNNCGGLPLSIVVVAGILSKVGKDPYLWKEIASYAGNLETLMSLSYNHLGDDYVRSCFLYMGGFPEDYKIHVSELIKLWIGERFIKCPTGSKSMEEEAEDCLENLVERNLVLVTNRKVDGKIKSCSVHDMVRDFCIRQAEREKFLLSVVDYLPSPILRKHFLPRLLKNHGRISLTSHDLDLKDSMHASSTHSIVCIPQRGYKSVDSVQKFSSLKVFHVLRRNNHRHWHPGDQVFDLIYLTYLASNIPNSRVPPAISNLQNLQTLIIYEDQVELPVEIWSLRHLKHLIAFSFHPLPDPGETTSPLENLETVSLVKYLVCSKKIMGMIPNTKKLVILFDKTKDYDNIFKVYHLENLENLCKLEKLKLEVKETTFWQQPRLLVFPRSLKKLTLCGWGLHWEEKAFGSLPNLQVLKLRNYAWRGRCWKTIEGEFGELRLLLIDRSNMQTWETESSHFPQLEFLTLLDCPYLSEIPSQIGDIQTLKLIEVDVYLLESAIKIQDKQRRSGKDSFQVRTKKRS